MAVCIVHLLLLTAGVKLMAQEAYLPLPAKVVSESWRWNQFPELSGAGVRCLIETRDGKVWVGSSKGVLSYDGYDWLTYDEGESGGLPNSPVERLLEAADGSIYATNTSGIYRYDGQQWKLFFSLPKERRFTFTSLRELANKSLIACSNWGFMHFLTNGEVVFYSSRIKKEGIEEDMEGVDWVNLPPEVLSREENFVEATDVLQTVSGEIWLTLTSRDELGHILRAELSEANNRLTAFSLIEPEDRSTLGEDQQLFQAQDGRIWVINSTSNKGILVFDGQKWETILLNDLFGGDEYMTGIVQSTNGTIWLSSIARIFSLTPAGEWEQYRAPQFPVPANRIILQKSQNDQIWVAGYKSKLLRLDCSTEQWLTLSNLSFQFQVSDDEQWFLEENNQVVRNRNDSWTAFGEPDGLMDAPVRLIRTSRGQTWAAGSHKGKAATALLKGDRWELFVHPRLSWGIDYRAVFEARDGTLWFGGAVDAQAKDGFLSGLLQLPDPFAETPEWIHHVFGENGLYQANVYGIGQSVDGRIWIGGSRLLFFDGEKWNALPDERLQQFVNYIHSTEDLLLVGSRYYGLFVYDGKTWKNYSDADGLSGNTVISIDALSDSVFIVATENDICKFDGVSWTNNVFPESLNLDFEGGTILHTDKYIWINHVPRRWKRRAYQRNTDRNQEYNFFMTRYQPSERPPETTPVFYREKVPADGNGLISWEGKDHFQNSSANLLSYSHRLDGGKWSPFARTKQYSFNGLASGDHLMEIRARDLDFNVDATPARIEFKVLPPIWKQAWFISLIIVFLTIYGFYEYRVHRKKKQLEVVNASLQGANHSLQEKTGQIERQNQEILSQQQRILEQSEVLESRNKDLQERNLETSQQRDKLEELLQQLQNLSKAKLVFFTNISHELRTPLTLILGPISHLWKEDEELSPSERKQLYGLIQRNGNRLLKLINQLLEIRRIEQSTLAVKLSDVSSSDFFGGIVSMFTDLSTRREVALSFVDNCKNRLISIDADKVEKVLVNLLSNAFRHAPDGRGNIQVSLDKVNFRDKELDHSYEHYLEVRVVDNGSGISPDKLEQIFEQYYTSEPTISDHSGMGIGLSYVKDLVYLMQGEIRVNSNLGNGSEFQVYLPYVEVELSGRRKKAVQPRLIIAEKESTLLLSNYGEAKQVLTTNGVVSKAVLPKVLVVEDNTDMLHFLEGMLRGKYQVITATNGEEALELAQNVSIDLIVSDVMMAKMDGLAFCGKIKESILTSHIPIILLTARVLDANKMSGYTQGADDYITKPFNPALLLIRIENLLNQRNTFREAVGREFMLAPKSEVLSSPDEEFMTKLVSLMNENVSESEFNVNAMCQAMHLSHMHFIRKVKQLTGKKPIALLKSFRMKKAKELLAQKKCTIAEVAYRVGFDLPNSFSRSFKKEFDVSPSEYLKSIQGDELVSK